jgi:diacylglycerol kinase family enzyme
VYYYIFDQPQGANEYQRTAQIKERLGALGIAGEMTTPVPGRSVQDLVHNAVAKRYATIVAVGGIALINQVARAIEPYDLVLGIIPLQENPDINALIGSSTWEDAAEQLKKRRWQAVRLGMMQDGICFMTPATISVPAGMPVSLSTPDFQLIEKNGAEITVTTVRGESAEVSSLQVSIVPHALKRGFLSGLMGSSVKAPTESSFTVAEVTIAPAESLPVHVAGESITTTPLHCRTQEKPVKLIVARGGISKTA